MVSFCFLGVMSLVMGQSGNNSKDEVSVEESYLQESPESIIIREQSRSDSRDGQLIALEYIDEAIKNGNTSDEIRVTLEYMGLEGLRNVTRENGRIVNNFPDVRAKTAVYLGEIGTAEAKESLIKMLLADNEPMVLTEAIKSLTKIGVNENDETVSAIAWIVRRYDSINPNNLLALAALEAFDSFGQSNEGVRDPSVIQAIIRIRDGRYIKPVQDKARNVLSNVRNTSSQNRGK
jgi:plasmid stability protein